MNRLRRVLLNGIPPPHFFPCLVSHVFSAPFSSYWTGYVSTLCEIPSPRLLSVSSNKTIIIPSGLTKKLYKVNHQNIKIKIFVSNSFFLGAQNCIVEAFAGSGKQERTDGKPDQCGFTYPNTVLVHVSFVSYYFFY